VKGIVIITNAAFAMRSLSAILNGDLQTDGAAFCGGFGK